MVINHLLNGMILQVRGKNPKIIDSKVDERWDGKMDGFPRMGYENNPTPEMTKRKKLGLNMANLISGFSRY